jgi:CoA:oxalate CoA-transferase
VLELGHYIAVPFCAQMLADQGADVIKVESPAALDGRFEHYFAMQNRNKRGVILDLKQEGDQAQMRRIADTCDVLLTNFAPGVPERLGFGYNDMSSSNPQLVYVHVSGFGLDGPYANYPAYDGVIQANTGLLHLTGDPDGQPALMGAFVPDYVSALYATVATLLALRERDSTGVGRLVDLSMADGVMTLLGAGFSEVMERHEHPMRSGGSVRKSFAGVYAVTDGYVYLAPLTVPMWKAMAHAMEAEDLLDYVPPRSANGDERLGARALLDSKIEAWSRERSASEVVEIFHAAGVPASEILDIEHVIAHPQVAHRRMVRRLPLGAGGSVSVAGSPIPAVPEAFEVPPPTPGQHTFEVLREAEALLAAKASGTRSHSSQTGQEANR